MNMESSLKTANVVIAARQFNPTIFDQIWLLDNELATREDFRGENVFTLTPPFVQFRAPAFALVVLPDQLQFAPQPVNERAGQLILDKVGRIVELLPQTPYVAVGLNYVWHLIPDASQFAGFCKDLFSKENPLFAAFDVDDARYGGYLSKNVLGARLKLDIKPVTIGAPPEGSEALQFAFNYNLDLPRSAAAVDQILDMLRRWDEARNQSQEIVHAVQTWR